MLEIGLKKNEIQEAVITGYSSEGSGICRIANTVVFVPGTIAGEKWRIRIVKVNQSEAYGRAEELLEGSPERIEPDCAAYPKCGGCALRHMTYAEELRFKLQHVNDCLTRLGGQMVTADEILGSECTEAYRDKGIYEFAEKDGRVVCGFYHRRSHDIIPVSDCQLQKELANRAANALLDFLQQKNISAYNEMTGKGTVRHLFCRSAVHTKDVVVCIVSADGFGANTSLLVESMRDACPELTGIVLNINRGQGNAVLAGDFYTLWGKPEIEDTLCGLKFSISPRSFFQINPAQTERLYAKAVEYAFPEDGGLALDLYCGTGTISLCIARHAAKVIGAEIIPEAVENARSNAMENHIDNTEFICADAGKAAAEMAAREVRPNVIVIDPPRKGISEETASAILTMAPDRIVYVSCNPATLARDIKRLSEDGYVLQKAAAVDMFPRTYHVETVCLMSRKEK